MGTRTVYVSADDEPLYARAAEFGGGLSPAITAALRAYVNVREAAMNGYTEITVKVGEGWAPQQKKFSGRRLVRLSLPGDTGRIVRYDVYRTQREQIAVHVSDLPDWVETSKDDTSLWNDPATWTSDWYRPGPRQLEVFPSPEAMGGHLPDEVVDAARQAVGQQPVEVLDI